MLPTVSFLITFLVGALSVGGVLYAAFQPQLARSAMGRRRLRLALGDRRSGDRLHLERALAVGDRVRVPVGEEQTKIHLFVATLGYSRRTYVAMFLHERQSAWLPGLEDAFRHFGGMTREVLIDNASALVAEHDAQTREVAFNDRFHAFCRYWGVTPRAAAFSRSISTDRRGAVGS